MISVVVYAQKPERPARLLAELLRGFGTVGVHLPDVILQAGEGEAVFSVEAVNRLERLSLPGAVLLFADQSVPRRLELDKDVIVVTGTDNRRVQRLLGSCTNPVVTCGTGIRDTVTISSLTKDHALLCAQRELPTVTGKWLEPFEFGVDMQGCGIRSALLAAGTAAVCGCDLSGGSIVVGSQGL